MKVLLAISLALICSVARAQDIRSDYCDHDPYGRTVTWNIWHCGAPDERRPRERAMIEVEPSAPGLYLSPRQLDYTFVYREGRWITDYDWSGLSLSGTPFITESSVVSDNSMGYSYRGGGDEQLAALGPRVYVGDMEMGHICIPGQKYISLVALREIKFTVTFTCAKDKLHLIGPAIKRTVMKVESVPYTGGTTWTNIHAAAK